MFLVGVVLAWLTWRGNSLRVAIAAHATYNAIVLLIIANMTLPADRRQLWSIPAPVWSWLLSPSGIG